MSDTNVKSESNRANAQLSTGPKTPEGKAVSALNGTTHGFAASRISPRNPEAVARYEQRKAAYFARYPGAAEDALQSDLIETIATARTRVELIEERQAGIEDESSHEYQLLQRYWRDANRGFHNAVKLLESIRNQPALQNSRAQAAVARAEAERTAAGRLVLGARRLQFELLEKEIPLKEKEKAVPLASLRQALDALIEHTAAPRAAGAK